MKKQGENQKNTSLMLTTGSRVLPDDDGNAVRFPTLEKKAENNFCVLLLLNSATMNIAFSFAPVYSHVLDLSLCLSGLLAQRTSENKAQTAFFS